MTIAPGIWLVRPEAEPIGIRLQTPLDAKIYRPWLNSGNNGGSSNSQRSSFQSVYREHPAWILVMATGIAVRYLEGVIHDKKTDPAVVVLDEGCHHAIALLGGHEGGANKLAFAVSNAVGAVPVITTATEALKPLIVGIGCRKDTTVDQIEKVVTRSLGARMIDEVREIVTIDLKSKEPGLLQFCERHAIPLRYFSKADITERQWTTKPSSWVQQNIGLDGVCEPCALMASPRGRLIVPKTTNDGVAIAIVEDIRMAHRNGDCCTPSTSLPAADHYPSGIASLGSPQTAEHSHNISNTNGTGKLNLVSVGPGFAEHITPSAIGALQESDVIVAYEPYLQWIKPWISGKVIETRPLTQERERATTAIELARAGRKVSLVSSGDIGVYAMAALAFEELLETDKFAVNVVPGITAANACSSLLGSPLSHDFATLSLSDLLCPWQWIEERARHLAQADLCVALYNVQSRERRDGIYKILKIFLDHKDSGTICGVVRNAYRPDQTVDVYELADLLKQEFDMFTTIIIGNKHTKKKGNFVYTPRGYSGWYKEPENGIAKTDGGSLDGYASMPFNAIWVFTGTGDGNQLAHILSGNGSPIVVSVATAYGAEAARSSCADIHVVQGCIGKEARLNMMSAAKARMIVDATHPHADTISRQLISLSGELHIPYIRYERPKVEVSDPTVYCDSVAEAASRAISVGGRIFLATGSKDLNAFLNASGAKECQWFMRITPDQGFIKQSLDLGIPRNHICAMQGPFSREFNVSLWKDWQITCIVTKESGSTGGFAEKIEAARQLSIPILVIKRPEVNYPLVVNDFESVRRFVSRHGGSG